MTRIPQSAAELQQQLEDQIDLLNELIAIYDRGKIVAAKSMASSIRVLLHDTQNSHALLFQVGDFINKPFLSTAELREQQEGNAAWSGSYSGLIGVSIGSSNGYVPNLDAGKARWLPFSTYWNEIIFIDEKNNSFTRKDIILAVANQDGGSHVDPGLDPKYRELSRNNSLGFYAGSIDNMQGLSGAELASIRQIAHEVMKTLNCDYLTPERKGDGIVMGGVGVVLHFEPAVDVQTTESPKRKGPCPCGSGKKYKRCHGK